MSLIDVSNLSFSYETNSQPIFENASFQIDTSWKLGFISRNGRGKTTFLHLLLGAYPYQGKISTSVAFDYFPFHITNSSQNTIDLLSSLHENFKEWELKKELSLLELSETVLSRPFSTLSQGEQIKTLIGAMFIKENRFLLLDEPTTHLDHEGKEILKKYLQSKQGFILVSHDRDFLDSIIDHVLSINKTTIEVQKGTFSTWHQNKERHDQAEISENEVLQKDLKRLTQSARQSASWSDQVESSKFDTRIGGLRPDRGRIGHKAAKLMKRSKNLKSRQLQIIEEKSKLLKNIETQEPLKLIPLHYSKKYLVHAQELSISFQSRQLFDRIRFTIHQGDRIHLTGKNGSGKSSLLKLLQGQIIPHSGTIDIRKNLVLSVVPQDTSFLKGSLKSFIANHQINETLFKSFLRKLDFDRSQFEKPLEDYSAGQKKKVLLAQSLSESAHLYLWDEPLNSIDIISRIQIEKLILTYKPTLIFVEHDLMFSQNIATKTISL